TSKYLFRISDISALVLGTTLGGTAASVAVPLLRGLNLQERTKTALVLESILGNVLSIVVTLALMTALERGKHPAPTLVLRDVASSFTMACVIGGIFGYMWSSLLVRIRTLTHTKFTTPACVCISYGFAEMFGFSGMLSALAFGIVMGNAERLPHSKLSSSTWLRPISLNDDERALFAELVFLLKTFFFVYLGISIQKIGVDIVYAGSIIVLWLFISRPLIVRLALPRIKTTKVDATIACIMIPRGLAAAVLASIAVSKGLEDSIILQSLAYSVILISIAATALFSFFCERKLLTQPYRFIFTGYKEDPEPADSEEEPVSEEVLETSILHYVEDYHHHPTPTKKSDEGAKNNQKLKLVEKKDQIILKEKTEKKEEKEEKKKKAAPKNPKKPAKGGNSQKPEPKHDIMPVITASTVSLSHSVGPGIDLTAGIVAHHHHHEEESDD
ncbi:MAG TPA: cation:proton antiporter, partial [Candidatus Melainabacteria bacterium]|nr:cation:proton antiporter [Candidatus Melainabacteria bacterium]